MNTELLTVAQTAEYLQLSEKTVRRLINKGVLPASKLGDRLLRIRSSDIDDYVASTSNSCRISCTECAEIKEDEPRLI